MWEAVSPSQRIKRATQSMISNLHLITRWVEICWFEIWIGEFVFRAFVLFLTTLHLQQASFCLYTSTFSLWGFAYSYPLFTSWLHLLNTVFIFVFINKFIFLIMILIVSIIYLNRFILDVCIYIYIYIFIYIYMFINRFIVKDSE